MTTTKPIKKATGGDKTTTATTKLATNIIASYARLTRATACFISKPLSFEQALLLAYFVGLIAGSLV